MRVILETVVCLAIAVTLFYRSRQFSQEDPERGVRNQLFDLAKAWAILAVLYGTAAALEKRGFPIGLPQKVPAREELYLVLAWHSFVMVLCTFTNFMIRRAALMLEFPDRCNSTRIEYPFIPPRLRTRARRAVYWISEEGILAALVVSLFVIAASGASKGYAVPWAVPIAYAISLFVSAAVLIRLAKAYWFASGSRLLSLTAVIYGLLQLLYVPGHLWAQPAFPWVFLACKPAFGFIVVLNARHLLNNVSPEHRGRLNAPGRRFEGIARIHALGRITAYIVFVFAALAALWFLWVANVNRHVVALAAAVAPFVVQYLGLLVRRGLSEHVHYEYFCESTIPSRFNVDQRRQLGAHWVAQRMTVASLAGGISESRTDPASAASLDLGDVKEVIEFASGEETDPAQVVLVHGLFSSGERTWGLLPLLLLERGAASRVEMLDYSTGLLSGETQLQMLAEELRAHLEDLVLRNEGRTVIIAHSLGALLTMEALCSLRGAPRPNVLRRISRVVLVGSPYQGSRYAALAAPWPVYWALRFRSPYVTGVVSRFADDFPALGQIVGEESERPAVSFVGGSRDLIAGSVLRALSPPGQIVNLPGWHSVSAVFLPDSQHEKTFLEEVGSPSRDLLWMRVLAAQFSPNGNPGKRFVFSLEEKDSLDTAFVRSEVRLAKGEALDFYPKKAWLVRPVELLSVLRRAWEEVPRRFEREGIEETWPSFEKRLSEAFVASREHMEIVRIDFGEEHACILYCGERAGFVSIERTRMRSLRRKRRVA